MTLALLWQEYKAEHPEGLQYSQFCERYRTWRQRLDVVMRQTHRAGEKLFVDYAGHRVPVVERVTGELRKAHVFVAVLGASNYTFAEATWTQALPDWCASHVRALRFFHGVPEMVIPDNLAAAVTRLHPDRRLRARRHRQRVIDQGVYMEGRPFICAQLLVDGLFEVPVSLRRCAWATPIRSSACLSRYRSRVLRLMDSSELSMLIRHGMLPS